MNSTTNKLIEGRKADIEFYGFPATNSWKILIMLDELGLSFNYHNIDIINGQQFTPDFIKINPNNKVPAIIDNTVEPPFTVIESGAILIYLAEKYGKLLPDTTKPKERSEVLQWLMVQIASVGPMFGQLSHFSYYASVKIDYAIDRYKKECERILNVLNERLATRDYFAGDELSIADIANYGWLLYLQYNLLLPGWDKYSNISKWFKLLETRPSFQNAFYLASEDMKQRIARDAAKNNSSLVNNGSTLSDNSSTATTTTTTTTIAN